VAPAAPEVPLGALLNSPEASLFSVATVPRPVDEHPASSNRMTSNMRDRMFMVFPLRMVGKLARTRTAPVRRQHTGRAPQGKLGFGLSRAQKRIATPA
jgi:hypothetical protein